MSAKTCAETLWFPPEAFYTDELCNRCGICCGATDGQPCEHLRANPDKTWYCEIYPTRLGPRRTTDGTYFLCVPIKTLIETHGGYAPCAYVKEIRRIRQEMGQPTDDLGRQTKPKAD